MPNEAVRSMLESGLKREPGVVLWPRDNTDIPDDRTSFKLVYLGPEFALLDGGALDAKLDDLHRYFGQTRRQYRNGLAFVLPSPEWDHGLPLSECYDRVALPGVGAGYFSNTTFVKHPLVLHGPKGAGTDAIALHARIQATLAPFLCQVLEPCELRKIIGLGEMDATGVIRFYFPLYRVARWFFSFPSLPKLGNPSVLVHALREGLRLGEFGLLRTEELIELDRRDAKLEKAIQWHVQLSPDELEGQRGLYLAAPMLRERYP